MRILAALYARDRTGRGQRVDVSLVGSQIWAQASEYAYFGLSGRQPGRANYGHPLLHAAYFIVPTADAPIPTGAYFLSYARMREGFYQQKYVDELESAKAIVEYMSRGWRLFRVTL